MVSLDLVESSNNRIKSDLPAGLVAVFVGGTNGVGETTVKRFAKYAAQPRVYIVGRSQEAGDRVVSECEALNPEGTFVFLKRETSLIRKVDEVCNEIVSKEEAINLLFLTIGTLQVTSSRSTHVPTFFSLFILCRNGRRAELPNGPNNPRSKSLHHQPTPPPPPSQKLTSGRQCLRSHPRRPDRHDRLSSLESWPNRRLRPPSLRHDSAHGGAPQRGT